MAPDKPVLLGRVESGVLCHKYPALYRALLDNLEGEEVIQTIKRYRKRRSVNQNSYYFGVVLTALAEQFGYDEVEDLHYEMRKKFLKTGHSGELIKTKKTSTLETVEFEEYLAKIRRWALMDWGITIPLPNEVEI